LRDDVVAGIEENARGDDPVAGLNESAERGKDGGHAARRGAAGFGAFEEAQALLEHGDGRIRITRIDEARAVIDERRLRLLGGVVDVAGTHVDGFAGLHEFAAQMAGTRHDRARLGVAGELAER
jgi:hypothetical protein